MHPTKRVLNPFFRRYHNIDVMLAPLIKEMWRAGVETDESCQEPDWTEKPNFACIWFDDVKHYRLLTEILFSPDVAWSDDELLQHACLNGDTPWELMWDVEINTVIPVPEEHRYTVDNESVLLQTCWTFPHSDIDEMIARLKTYNKRQRNALRDTQCREILGYNPRNRKHNP